MTRNGHSRSHRSIIAPPRDVKATEPDRRKVTGYDKSVVSHDTEGSHRLMVRSPTLHKRDGLREGSLRKAPVQRGGFGGIWSSGITPADPTIAEARKSAPVVEVRSRLTPQQLATKGAVAAWNQRQRRMAPQTKVSPVAAMRAAQGPVAAPKPKPTTPRRETWHSR